MLSREYLLNHLTDNTCRISENGSFEDGEFYVNVVNFKICWVPIEDEYSETTYCDIFFELKIPAPDGLEDELERFREFREELANIKEEEEEE